MSEDFIIFFREKRIDIEALKKSREILYDELKQAFGQLGPHSFDQQKKFIFNPLRLDFPLDIPIEETLKAKKGKVLPKKKIPLPNKNTSATGTEAKARKAPSLKRPLMQKKEGEAGKVQKKAPPLKRPIMRKNTDENSTNEKPKAPPLKRPIMKRNTEEKGSTKERPKPPPLKRPIMKSNTDGDESKEKKKPSLKKPIMKPRKPKD